jgi:hypothetical protein
MDKAHEIDSISFSGLIMRLRVDGKEYEIDISTQSERLTAATPQQRAHFIVSPSGYGIHWPEIDEDLSIDGLIGARYAAVPGKASA